MQERINSNSMYGISNAIVQTGSIFAYSYLSISWPMYIVMGMICLLGLVQTIASAGVLSGLTDLKENQIEKGESYQILIGIIYGISAYQIYLMGFVIFSGFAAAHAAIYTMIVLCKRIKQ